jgi:hypothetical protein
MRSLAKPADTPIAAEGGIRAEPPESADPYQALDELMVAVEALCPRWPERPPFPANARLL